LTSEHLKAGFVDKQGQHIPLVNPQRGIFKPRSMRYLLSIRTVYPRAGNRIWYDDQRQVHQQLYAGDESVDYAFMGTDADAADNRWLREAWEQQIPLLYFLGISPGRYHAIVPAFIAGWDRQDLKARVAFGLPGEQRLGEEAPERRYALHMVQAAPAPGIVPGRRDFGLPGTLRAFRAAGADAAGCGPHHRRPPGRLGAACRAQRHPAVQDPPRRV
jgi:putative restriction endonuclease